MQKLEVWKVQIEWAYGGESGVETQLFHDENEAQDSFNKLKENEKKTSWISDHEIATNNNEPDEETVVIDDDSDTRFSAYLAGYDNEAHTYITLEKVEVK